jgi:uncharacterized protein (DUF4415 family)
MHNRVSKNPSHYLRAEIDPFRTPGVRGSRMKEEYDFSKGTRGPIDPILPGKTRITIRLDNEILDRFRSQVHEAGGGNYQTLINRALRDPIERQTESVEEILRRVLREELKSSA